MESIEKAIESIKYAISVTTFNDCYDTGLRNGLRLALYCITNEEPEIETIKEEDILTYIHWLQDMFHKYGHDEYIALLVKPNEEALLADILKNKDEAKQPIEPLGVCADGTWTCGFCIYENPKGNIYCGNCGRLRKHGYKIGGKQL